MAGDAHLLLGVLSSCGRWRSWIAEAQNQPHLIEGLHPVATRLGGLTRRWRFDQLAAVCQPGSGRLQASFGPVAMHYAVGVDICPARRAWRKGAVEKSAHVAAQRWWRTLPDDVTPTQAQASLDRLCAKLDARVRTRDGVRTTVGALADTEPRRPLPAPLPAALDVERTVTSQALVAFRGNRYLVPPGHAGEVVHVWHTLGSPPLDVATGRGILLAHHVCQPDGASVIVRLDEHVEALTRVVLATFTDREPRRRKTRHPPREAARAETERIRRARAGGVDEDVVVDLARYAAGTRPLRAGQAGAKWPPATPPTRSSR